MRKNALHISSVLFNIKKEMQVTEPAAEPRTLHRF